MSILSHQWRELAPNLGKCSQQLVFLNIKWPDYCHDVDKTLDSPSRLHQSSLKKDVYGVIVGLASRDGRKTVRVEGAAKTHVHPRACRTESGDDAATDLCVPS